MDREGSFAHALQSRQVRRPPPSCCSAYPVPLDLIQIDYIWILTRKKRLVTTCYANLLNVDLQQDDGSVQTVSTAGGQAPVGERAAVEVISDSNLI